MERKPEGAAAEVPASEKPNIPLNSLKMMFEKGENLSDKASPHFSHGDRQAWVKFQHNLLYMSGKSRDEQDQTFY